MRAKAFLPNAPSDADLSRVDPNVFPIYPLGSTGMLFSYYVVFIERIIDVDNVFKKVDLTELNMLVCANFKGLTGAP